MPTTGRRRTAARTDSRSGAPASELGWMNTTCLMGLYVVPFIHIKEMSPIADGLATCEPLHVRKISWHYFQTACLRFVGAPRAFLTRLVPTTGRRRTAARTDSRSGAPASELGWMNTTCLMGLYVVPFIHIKEMSPIADGLATCEPLHVRKISWHYFQTACLRFVGAPRGAPASEPGWMNTTCLTGLYVVPLFI